MRSWCFEETIPCHFVSFQCFVVHFSTMNKMYLGKILVATLLMEHVQCTFPKNKALSGAKFSRKSESSHWYIDHDTGVNIDPFYYALCVFVYAFNLALLCVWLVSMRGSNCMKICILNQYAVSVWLLSLLYNNMSYIVSDMACASMIIQQSAGSSFRTVFFRSFRTYLSIHLYKRLRIHQQKVLLVHVVVVVACSLCAMTGLSFLLS